MHPQNGAQVNTTHSTRALRTDRHYTNGIGDADP